jgi:hypothetical protein
VSRMDKQAEHAPVTRQHLHAHPDAAYHLWVVAGAATITGKTVPYDS